jgi:hypothetical protein
LSEKHLSAYLLIFQNLEDRYKLSFHFYIQLKPKRTAKKSEELPPTPSEPPAPTRCLFCQEPLSTAELPYCPSCQDLCERAQQGRVDRTCAGGEACAAAASVAGRCDACRLAAAEAAGVWTAEKKLERDIAETPGLVVVTEAGPVDGVS